MIWYSSEMEEKMKNILKLEHEAVLYFFFNVVTFILVNEYF